MLTLPSKLKDIDISSEEPFANDLLGMEQYAFMLRTVIEMHADEGSVIALNGDWGTGKTTFMKMWKAYIERFEVKTVYFNAWETDYYKDPLTAIIGQLKHISKEDSSFVKFCASAGKIGLGVSKSVILSLLKNHLGIDSVLVKDAIDSSESVLLDRIKDYEEQKSSIEDFKKALTQYVAEQDAHPLVFIIDELDRCNPHYAVKLLELVKHIFDVPNIIFVLSICRKELENSIRGYYGSDRIDASNYLRRFIDIQFDMPKPNGNKFISMLIKYYGFQEYIINNCRVNHVSDGFYDMATLMFSTTNIDLRTWDRIFAYTRLSACQFGGENMVIIDLIFILCFLKITQTEFYSSIRRKAYSVQGLIDNLEKNLPKEMIETEKDTNYTKPSNSSVILAITELLYIYDFSINGMTGPIISCNAHTNSLNVKFSIINQEQIINGINRTRAHLSLNKDITLFTDKVDLASNFKD